MMRADNWRSSLVAVFALSTLFWVGSAAAPAQQQRAVVGEGMVGEGMLRESVDVDLFELEVRVTDRKGVAIEGLGARDFEVLENGVPVEPTFFAETSAARTVKGSPRKASASAEGPIWLVLYVDNHNMRSANRDRALEEFEQDLRPRFERGGIQVMVVSYDSELEVVQRFTQEWSDFKRALARLRGAPSVGDDRDAFRRSTQISATEAFQKARGTDRLDRQNAALAIDALLGEMKSYASQEHTDTESTLAALATVIRSLAWVQGPKALVYLSDGLAERPLGELIKQAQNLMTGGASNSGDLVETRSGGQADTSPGSSGVFGRDATMELGRFQQEIEPWQSTSTIAAVVAEASSYGVTLFVAKPPPGDAEASSRRSKSRGALIDLTDLREGLHTLADGSGGFASTSATSLAGFLPEVIEGVSSHHYSLGLSAAGKADGEYTAIEVKVKQQGAQAHYRSGYIKKSLSSRISERALAGLELGQSDNPHLIEVHIDSMTAASEGDPSGVGESGDVEVQFRIEVPIRNLELIHRNGLRVADARLVVVAMDEDRKLTAAQHLALPLEVPDAAWYEARSSHYRGSITLRLPAGKERVAVGLWDDVAKAGSILTDTLTVSAR